MEIKLLRLTTLLMLMGLMSCREHADVSQANAAYDARVAQEKIDQANKDAAGTVIIPGVTAVGTGQNFACAISYNAVSCWGKNNLGQIGNGILDADSDPSNDQDDAQIPRKIISAGAQALSVGHAHACAIVSKELYCWGDNSSGQLGDGGAVTSSNIPTKVAGLTNVTSVAAGTSTTCAIADESLYCWGKNDKGQLGLGDDYFGDSSVPYKVTRIFGVPTQVATDKENSCVVASGALYCWGAANAGYADSAYPIRMIGSGVTKVAIGRNTQYICAIVSGALKCMGDNTNSDIGDGTVTLRTTPVTVIASGVTDISTGDNPCAVVSGVLKCWGTNNAYTPAASTPTDYIGSGAKYVSTSATESCYVTTDATLECWGNNSNGALALNSSASHLLYYPIPITVP